MAYDAARAAGVRPCLVDVYVANVVKLDDLLKTTHSGAYLHSCCSSGPKNGGFWLEDDNGWLALGSDVILIHLLPLSRFNMSSKLPSVLAATDEEIQLLLAAQSHIGSKNCDKQMLSYVWKRRSDG